MTQTLTTERLREILERRSPSLRWGEAEKIAAELLANREAQPVNTGIFTREELAEVCKARVRDMPENYADHQIAKVALNSLYTAPPAPAYPEILPCAVRLMPGVIFGEGVRTSIMLDGLRRREEHNAEMAAMTPEQKDEQSAAIKALFSRMTPPAPAVSEEISSAIRHLKDSLVACNRFNYCADAVNRVEDACRAAILAQPVSGGYKLNSPVIPDGCQWTFDEHDSKWDSGCGEAWMFCDGGPTENGVKFCQSCGKPVLLAAAPEGGNG